MDDTSYDVRIWRKFEVYKGKRKTTHTVRWSVGGKRFREPHATAALADAFRSDLVNATNNGEAFRLSTGRPVSWAQEEDAVPTWFAFVCSYVDEHWRATSAKHRQDRARILTDATEALWSSEAGKPDSDLLRLALQRHAFNTAHRSSQRSADLDQALQWAATHTVPMDALMHPPTMRAVLTRITSKKDGTRTAPSSAVKAKRVLSHVLDYAVECGHLPSNPIALVKWSTPVTNSQVDRHAVPNPAQARALIDVIAGRQPSGPRLEAFFSTLFLAALRPEEAVNLTWADVVLPSLKGEEETERWEEPDAGEDWGEIIVREVAPDVGRRWTDSGYHRDRRQPKGRPEGATRTVPSPPRLTRILRRHRQEFGDGPGGLVFFGVRGRQLDTGVYQRAWDRARSQALTADQQKTPLARRPYDLRHACVSLWLNQATNPAQVAEWAGHSVHMLLKVYARCIDGRAEVDKRQAAKGFDGF
ncbi:tyrosine-type recombinase/integrase [Streptomonospora halophila]|uniref:Tyrosine-type recombinase/integrase n=1 Tax=Streptomonospora halophila TaxID=427369 RepID=A0ABP9GBL6_9ACTN